MWKTGKNAFLGALGLSVAGLVASSASADGYARGWRGDRTVTVVKKVYVRDDRRWQHKKRRVVQPIHHSPRPVQVTPVRVAYDDRYQGGGYSDRTVLGGLIGAAVGALAGNSIGKGSGRVAAIIGGGIIGAIAGGNIGQSMDRVDTLETAGALESAKTGQTVSWRNPDSGAEYNVTPTRTYRGENGRYCRDFTTWGWIDGYEEKLRGTACRQDDGTWKRTS